MPKSSRRALPSDWYGNEWSNNPPPRNDQSYGNDYGAYGGGGYGDGSGGGYPNVGEGYGAGYGSGYGGGGAGYGSGYGGGYGDDMSASAGYQGGGSQNSWIYNSNPERRGYEPYPTQRGGGNSYGLSSWMYSHYMDNAPGGNLHVVFVTQYRKSVFCIRPNGQVRELVGFSLGRLRKITQSKNALSGFKSKTDFLAIFR